MWPTSPPVSRYTRTCSSPNRYVCWVIRCSFRRSLDEHYRTRSGDDGSRDRVLVPFALPATRRPSPTPRHRRARSRVASTIDLRPREAPTQALPGRAHSWPPDHAVELRPTRAPGPRPLATRDVRRTPGAEVLDLARRVAAALFTRRSPPRCRPCARTAGRRRAGRPARRTRCRPRARAARRCARSGPRAGRGHARASTSARDRRVASARRRAPSTIRPAQYASSSANAPLNPEQTIATSPPARARRGDDRRQVEQRAEQHDVAARDAAVRIARVPFVVVRISVRAFGVPRELARRCPDVEAFDDDRVALAADDRLVAELGAERLRLVDLGAAEHPLVARRERLGDRRGRADRRRRRCRRGRPPPPRRGERDMNMHADTLAAWTSRAIAIAIPTARRASRARSADGRSVTSA